MTLYLELGGRQTLETGLARLCSRLRLDPVLGPHARELEGQGRSDLCEFLAYLLGGAPVYEGTSVRTLLSPLCDCDETFDHLVDHLVTVLIGRTGDPRHEVELRLRLEYVRPMVLPAFSGRDGADFDQDLSTGHDGAARRRRRGGRRH